jgi:hypothetical protein
VNIHRFGTLPFLAPETGGGSGDAGPGTETTGAAVSETTGAAVSVTSSAAAEVSANEAPGNDFDGQDEGGEEGHEGLLAPEDDTDEVEHEGGMQADPAALGQQPPMGGM